MTRERIAGLSNRNLIKLAEIVLVHIDDTLPNSENAYNFSPDVRKKLEEQVYEALEEVRVERKYYDSLPVQGHQRHFTGIDELCFQRKSRKIEYTLPEKYNYTRIILMLRDPEWVFTYWDISRNDRAKIISDPLFGHFSIFLKSIADTHAQFSSDHKKIGEKIEADIPIHISDNNLYIHVPRGNCLYAAELAAYYLEDASEELEHESPNEESPLKSDVLARSGVIHVPGIIHAPCSADTFDSHNTAEKIEPKAFNRRRLT